MPDIIKDFDLLIPDKRIAILAGKKFDVSKISTRNALKYVIFRDSVLKMSGAAAFKKMIEITAEICNKPIIEGNIFKRIFNKAISEKWLIANSNYSQLLEFIDFILEPLMGKPESKKDDKAKKKVK